MTVSLKVFFNSRSSVLLNLLPFSFRYWLHYNIFTMVILLIIMFEMEYLLKKDQMRLVITFQKKKIIKHSTTVLYFYFLKLFITFIYVIRMLKTVVSLSNIWYFIDFYKMHSKNNKHTRMGKKRKLTRNQLLISLNDGKYYELL